MDSWRGDKRKGKEGCRLKMSALRGRESSPGPADTAWSDECLASGARLTQGRGSLGGTQGDWAGCEALKLNHLKG